MAREEKTIQVSGAMCETVPFLEPLAFGLLEDIRAFFQTEEAEKEFQEWLEDPEKVRARWRANACA